MNDVGEYVEAASDDMAYQLAEAQMWDVYKKICNELMRSSNHLNLDQIQFCFAYRVYLDGGDWTHLYRGRVVA